MQVRPLSYEHPPLIGDTPIYYVIQHICGTFHPAGTIGNTECCGSLEIFGMNLDEFDHFLQLVKAVRASIFSFEPWNPWADDQLHIFRTFNIKFKGVAVAHTYHEGTSLLVVIEIIDPVKYHEMLEGAVE